MGNSFNSISIFCRFFTKRYSLIANRFIILILFLLSGACGLIYENLWFKVLRLIFGNTTFALSTVLAAFMSGLAIGSWFWGRVIDRKGNPLILYGILECVIGVWCYATPFFKHFIEVLYVGFYQAGHPSFYVLSLFRFLLSFILLLVPTICMGGTLPVLSKFYALDRQQAAKSVSVLYAINTLGAIAGVIVSGFVLFPNIGIRSLFTLTALLNLGIGIFSVTLGVVGKKRPAGVLEHTISQDVIPPVYSFSVVQQWIVAGLLLSGIASMVYEICWTRILAMLIGSSVYAFTIMLATFLTGIFLGSLCYSFLPYRVRSRIETFIVLELLIGITVIGLLPMIYQIPVFFIEWQKLVSNNYYLIQIGTYFISGLLMFIPTFFIGLTFPACLGFYFGGEKDIGRSTGILYSSNTVGNIIGAFATGFILIPWIGIHKSIVLGAALNIAVAIVVLLMCYKTLTRRWVSIVLSSVCCLGVVVSTYFPWPESFFMHGLYLIDYVRKVDSRAHLRYIQDKTHKRLFYKEGVNCTVAVGKRGKNTYLTVNGKVDASTSIDDMATQMLAGYLPMFFADSPKDVLVIGLGSGVTVSCVAHFPVQRIDVAEIERAVVDASRLFEKENEKVLSDQRVHLQNEDGRNFLLQNIQTYDVIISEPSNPWIEGVASLFTVDFYRLAEQRLTRDGIMCQWMHLYHMSPKDVQMIVRTFTSVFPYVSVWKTTESDVVLLGRRKPFVWQHDQIAGKVTSDKISRDLAFLGYNSPVSLLTAYRMNTYGAKLFSKGAVVNTDDHNILEYSAPKYLYNYSIYLFNSHLLARFQQETTSIVPVSERALLSDGATLLDFAEAYLQRGNLVRADKMLRMALKVIPHNARIDYLQGKIALKDTRRGDAIGYFKKAVAAEPDNAEYHYALAGVYVEIRWFKEAEPFIREAVSLKPDEPRYVFLLSKVFFLQGRTAEASEYFKKAVALGIEQEDVDTFVDTFRKASQSAVSEKR